MVRKLVCVLTAVLALKIIGASLLMCPSDPNCVCGGTLAIELNCNIDDRIVKINLLPNTYINIKCENTTSLDYKKLPKCANNMNSFKSVSFKDCPLPASSFKDVLTNMGISKTMALIFQNAKNLSGYFVRKHFEGLQDLTKLLLSFNGITQLPDNLFMDINKLTWLNIRSNSINLSEELFKPLERLETLEISHNHMTNITSNLFSHLTFLRKLSLWQSNVTWFSKDLFTGVDVLEELDLSSNGLNELPWSIFKPLKKLKKLTLFSNKFSALPQNLFKYNNELETVVILNNDVKLKELPKYLFGNLQNLKQIYIQRCGLESLPYDVFANSPQITNISLAYNDITRLPESIFNDQINLLDLDLSHNKLDSLETKIFSSLVRLESLNLCHNQLVEIHGPTFSSLLSLIYLNMENNKLNTISSYLFSNNKQRMSISLAYNQLDFEHKELKHNKWIIKKESPFAHTYNLRLLNLSHNEFKTVFVDWWINGHEILDISHNYIKTLWNEEKSSPVSNSKNEYKDFLKKPLKEVWIAHNSLDCECRNFHFIDFIKENSKTKIPDLENFKCPLWSKESCYMRFVVFISLIISLVSVYMVMIILFVVYRKQINMMVKKKLCERKNNKTHMPSNENLSAEKSKNIIVKYCDDDEEFILKEMVPGLRCHNLKLHMNPIKFPNNTQNFMKNLTLCIKDTHKYTTLVVFSPNYLTSTYSHVNIKKIHGEMLKAENTFYVFVDIGPENSIYAFLKEQRNERTSVVWSEVDFWNKILSMLSGNQKKKVGVVTKKAVDSRTKSKMFKSTKTKLPSNISFSKLPDWSPLYNINPFSHSHV
ncbi:protein toll-like [Galleria mellonella]|uniref:Protein toll-like n=1 Tax=Galleria mellonella TaxID=7137 RepID=A0A6J3BU14_GALME|nr:protein toll-like [Galleria mellonella]